MGKLIAGINMTLDGYCDHTAVNPDAEVHQHYTDLLRNSDTIMWGRITFQLMEFWPTILKNPTGDKAMDDFAVAADDIKKIVYSRTLESVDWRNTELKREIDKDEILDLKQQAAGDILAGSPSLIIQMSQLGLVDEYQLAVHPVVVGSGLPLFKNIKDRIDLKLLGTKTFGSGAVFLYYEPKR
ncbi:MAG TPA: dihydrofolate reductase family protein [Pyrinomonadaceae bacterium]|nr:dihydrofolate reductase family protein [Pyrinomonadaceae bacterium]